MQKVFKYFLVFLAGIVIGRYGWHDAYRGIDSTRVTTPVASTYASPSTSAGLHLVARVIDGDTIELEGGERVRYIGIDTPETLDPRKPVQCFGKEASAQNAKHVEGKAVRLVRDVSDRDRYGRLLRYVYVGDVFVNRELVREGYAHAYTYPPDVAHQKDFVEAEREAREAGRGLWSACPGDGIAPSPVLRSSGEEGQRSPDCTIKGNISASGEKIYHLPTCGSYSKTQIDTARGEQWFCTEEEARAAGWRKAGNC